MCYNMLLVFYEYIGVPIYYIVKCVKILITWAFNIYYMIISLFYFITFKS